jgi:hypothetical protein
MNPMVLTDFIEKYWHKRTSKAGLLAGFVVTFVLVFLVSQAAHPLFNETGAISNDQESSQHYYQDWLYFLILCEFIYFIAWLCWRQVLAPRDDAILVIFAPWADDDHQDVVRKLYAQFNVELASRGFHNQIHAKLLPPEETILNINDANRVMSEKGARLVIFGRVAKGGIKGKQAEGFSEISFSIRHVIALEDANLLASSFSIEDFQILDENSMVDSRFASENLSNCACVFIGIGLTVERKYEVARQVWKSLFDKFKPNAATLINAKQIQFNQLVVRWFQWNEFCWIAEYYLKNVADKITSHSVDQYVTVCQERLNLLIRLNPKSPEYLHFGATLQFHRGATQEAIHALDEIEKLYPGSLYPIFSRPFLTLWQRKYKPALRYFKRLNNLKKSPPAPFTLSVVSFYESLISQYPARYELIFGSAFINDLFCDSKVAQENYKCFLEAVKKNNTYAPLDSYASERLLMLQNNTSENCD